jgi:integrative and conjugative element protein (TIGR02256 family)
MIYINKDALTIIENQVSKCQSFETGGILLGYHLNNGTSIITHAVTSRGRSIKENKLFKKDLSHAVKMENKLNKKYGTIYLGDWHKHPNNNTMYSFLDYLSILRSSIINNEALFFIIVGDDFKAK